MVLVHGDHCTEVRQDCLRWLDADVKPPPNKRCAQFAPSVCTGKIKHLRFCIDKLELAKTEKDLPTSDVSWTLGKQMCESAGKRLCLESEWTFACEGEEMRPYPTGYVRDSGLCNFDREDLVDGKKMRDYREPADANPQCESPFGVRNMVGNVDEWTFIDGSLNMGWRAALKGGWWLAGRNRCRPATTGHDEVYHDLQTGLRCCKDAP
jgi:formylglycine-generating enzyme required for sulfatase activity